MKIKFENANIVTCNNDEIIFGDLVVVDNVIEYVGSSYSDVCDKVIDCNGGILLPGLINCYANLNLNLYKGKICNNSVEEMYNHLNTLEKGLNENEIYNSKLQSYLQLIKNGVTCVADFGANPEISATIFNETNIRGVVPVGVLENEDNTITENVIENQIQNIKKVNSNCNFVVYAKNMYNLTDEQCVEFIKICKKFDIPFVTSASETLFEVGECVNENQATPIEMLESYGLFDIKCSLINAVNVDKEEMDILQTYNVNVISTPYSNLAFGVGVAPIFAYLNKNINIALGTGYSAVNSVDMLKEINLISNLQKGIMHNSKIVDDYKPICCATINGAKALNLNKIGVLQKGYFADIILLDGSNLKPLNNILKSVINFSNISNVKLTMIDGKIVYQNGSFTNDAFNKICI